MRRRYKIGDTITMMDDYYRDVVALILEVATTSNLLARGISLYDVPRKSDDVYYRVLVGDTKMWIHYHYVLARLKINF